MAVNSLLVSNTTHGSPNYSDCSGTLEAYGFNRLGDLSGCAFTGNGNAAIGLATRATVGPPRQWWPDVDQRVLAGSEAIDSSTAQGCVDESAAILGEDQRGAARVAGLRCDVGAYEYGAVIDRIFRSGFE